MMEKLYKIEKPEISRDISKVIPLLHELDDPDEGQNIKDAIRKTEFPEYLHWKDIKYKNWIPEQFKKRKEDFWHLVKFSREMTAKPAITPICDEFGKFFAWKKLDHYDKMFHEIDLDMSKYLLNFPNISKHDHHKYQLQGIMEEAIASSQLEGAHTTRKAAKQMIQEKREPKTHAEKMIYNNFITMKAIQEKYKDDKLSLDILFDMHRTLTVGTMKESEQGCFRLPSDKIVIQKNDDPTVISYITPNIRFVEKEMTKFIDFANDNLEKDNFIHPVIKAIMLHFWIGLLHPFVDGNGRLARGLFYWYLLRKGYWAFAFLPISIAIKSAPSQYSDAYILSEQDDNDLTYFIDYNIRKINQAVLNFKKHIEQKSIEKQRIDDLLKANQNLNRRQIEILEEFHQNPNKLVNVTSHKNTYEITKATAIKDLKGLAELGFVEIKKQGRNVFYLPIKK